MKKFARLAKYYLSSLIALSLLGCEVAPIAKNASCEEKSAYCKRKCNSNKSIEEISAGIAALLLKPKNDQQRQSYGESYKKNIASAQAKQEACQDQCGIEATSCRRTEFMK